MRLPHTLIFIFLFFVLCLTFSHGNPVFAATADQKSLRETTIESLLKQQQEVDSSPNGTTVINGPDVKTFDTTTTLWGGINQIYPVNKIKCPNGQLDDSCTLTTDDIKGSALGSIAYMMDTVYDNPPASGLAYTRKVLADIGIAKPAYAQGIGFYGLEPFMNFWKTTRNIAYSVIIIVMVAIGFMIIFRMKIDPKTVISVQAALPKIVLSLILITLSYAIVGFMIDIMYLVMAILISLIVQGMGGSVAGGTAMVADTAKIQSTYMNASVMDLLGAVFWTPLSVALKELPSAIGIGVGTEGLFVLILRILAGSVMGSTLAIVSVAFIFILLAGFLFTFIRLFLLLINSYIQLLISLVLGPIILLGEAIPGRSAFGGWIQNVLANLSVFPTTAVLLLAAVYLGTNPQKYGSWSPPFIGLSSTSGTLGAFHIILAVGVIFLSPNLVAQVKKMFGAKPTLPISAGTMFSPLTGAVQSGMSGMSQMYYLQQFTHGGIGKWLAERTGKGGAHH